MSEIKDTTDIKKRRFLVPRYIARELHSIRELGLKSYIRKRGKWVFLGIILFYLVRDTTLYIIIPYLVVNGVISCPGPQ